MSAPRMTKALLPTFPLTALAQRCAEAPAEGRPASESAGSTIEGNGRS